MRGLTNFSQRSKTAMLAGEPVAVSYDARFGYPNDFTVANEDTFVRDFEVLRYADESP